ncbi:MAG TPA: hypothetical protein VFU40_07085 [Gemmatimonadales bacterium]|nr:hypothetical protein [Gemmatimonadales bacterium]
MTTLVQTTTLAHAAGVSQQRISRLTQAGILTAYRPHLGLNGRPACWYDLDTAMAALAEHANTPKAKPARLDSVSGTGESDQ